MGNVSTSTHKKQPDPSDAKLPKRNADSRPKPKEDDDLAKAEKAYKATRSRYGGRLRNLQDVENRIANATWGDHVTGNVAKWEKEAQAERAQAKREQKAMLEQKAQMQKAREAKVRAEKAKAEANKATDPKIKKELQIKAQKEEDKVSDHVKNAKAARKKSNEESKKYLNDMKEASEPKPAKHEQATKAHEDVKQDKQKVRNLKVDAPTSANTKRLAEALDKQQKSTDSVVTNGIGIKTNVENSNSRAQDSLKTDAIVSGISPIVGMIMNGGMSTALLQERDNDRKLLEANNKTAAENLRNEKKLKETIKTVQEYEARAAKYKKLGDDKEAARYSKMAKDLTDQALSETKTVRTVRREETKSAGTNYIKEQKKVTEQYEAVADRNDKAAITMRVTRDVAVVAGATIATGGAATAIAATGAGTLAIVSGATAVGTLSGSTIGAVSNTAGAVSSGTTGYKTWGDAWKDAGAQTVQDAKSSFYSSAGTALGIGVAGKLASPIIGKVGEQGGRLALGSITAATGQTATTAMNLGEHFYNTSEEFNKLKSAGQVKESDRAQYFADRGLSPQAMGKSLAISFGTGVVGGNIGARSDLIREGATSVWGKVGATTLDTGGSAVIGLTTAYIQNDGKMTFEDFANEAAGAVTSVMQGNIGSKIGKHAASNSNAPHLKLETFDNNSQADLPIAAMRLGATLPPPIDITPIQPQKSIERMRDDVVNQPKAVASTHTGALGVVAYNTLNNEPGAKPARVIIMSPSGGDGITPAGIAYQLFRNRFAPNEHTGNNIGLQKVTVVCTPEQKPMLESALRQEMETNRPQAFATAGGTTRLEDYVDLVTARPGEVVNIEVHRSPLATEEAKAKTPASEKFAIKIPSEGSEKPTALVSKINPNDGSLQKVKRELHYKPEQQPELKPQSIVPVEGRPQLHAIGTGGLITPEPNSCLILTNGKIGAESRTFIIDDGNPNGFARSRGLYDLNPNNVEALTHFHADHTQGMMERIKIRSDSGVKNTLIVNKYTKAQVESYFTTTYGREAGQKVINSIDFKVLEPAENDTRSISYKPIQIGNTKIEAIRTRHNYGSEGRLEAVAYKYTFDNDGIKTSFVTTGDTQFGSRYLAAYSETVKAELDTIRNSKEFTTEDFDRTKKLVTTYFDEDGRAKFNDASNKSPSEQKAFIQDYLENELKTVAKHTKRNEKFDRELATFCKPADDVSSHLVYLDAGGAARPGSIPAVDTAHASGMVAPIHMGASDAQHLMHLVGVDDQRVNFIAGHTSSTAKVIGGTTAGSEGGNRSYDLRANKSIDWTSGYADGVTRVSSDGARAVYYADEKSLQAAYEGIISENDARSNRPLNESVSEVNDSKGVIAFYDRRTGAIHSIDPKFNGATKEARILTGALLRHEYTHHLQETNGVKINEVEAFKSMFDYVDRVNAKDPSRQFELRITNDNMQIHELEAGQIARRLSEAEIQRIVDHNYKNVDGAVAPLKVGSSAAENAPPPNATLVNSAIEKISKGEPLYPHEQAEISYAAQYVGAKEIYNSQKLVQQELKDSNLSPSEVEFILANRPTVEEIQDRLESVNLDSDSKDFISEALDEHAIFLSKNEELQRLSNGISAEKLQRMIKASEAVTDLIKDLGRPTKKPQEQVNTIFRRPFGGVAKYGSPQWIDRDGLFEFRFDPAHSSTDTVEHGPGANQPHFHVDATEDGKVGRIFEKVRIFEKDDKIYAYVEYSESKVESAAKGVRKPELYWVRGTELVRIPMDNK